MWNSSSKNSLEESNSNNQDENNLNENDLDQVNYECCLVKSRPLTIAAQQILVPNFFSVAASILTYFLIGITSSFDSIRVYCIFTSKLNFSISLYEAFESTII
jgi:hypothetical protein